MVQAQDLTRVDWDDVVEAIEKCYDLGWTDGLPVVPPTVERVEEFLAYVGRSPEEALGSLPERRLEITVGKVVANAVMAGCLPEYLPVVLAATEAMLDPSFNLIGPSSSQGSAAILVVVNGPIVRQLDINCRNNVFGPWQPGQRHHRQSCTADSDERLCLHPWPVRQEHNGRAGEVYVLHSGK